MSENLDDLGRVIDGNEPSLDPFALENIKAIFERFDEQLAYLGFHWERLAVSSMSRSGKELPNEDYFETRIASKIYVNIALGVLDGREPSKEQILILDYFVRMCCKALIRFQIDGTLPDGISEVPHA